MVKWGATKDFKTKYISKTNLGLFKKFGTRFSVVVVKRVMANAKVFRS